MATGELRGNILPEDVVRRLLPLVLCVAFTAPLEAQWRLAVLVGSATSHGDARNDADPSRPEFHANQPEAATISLGHAWGAWRMSIEARRTTADLAEVGSSDVIVSTRGAFSGWGGGLEVGARIAGHSPATLRAGIGMGIDRWTFDLGRARWRPSGRGALEAEFLIVQGWTAVVRGEVAGGASMFTAAELPEGFERHPTWRAGISMGVARAW